MDDLNIISITSNIRATEEILQSERKEKQYRDRSRVLEEFRRKFPEYKLVNIRYEPITIEIIELSKSNVKLCRNRNTYFQMSKIEKCNTDIIKTVKRSAIKIRLTSVLKELAKILRGNARIKVANNNESPLHNIRLPKISFCITDKKKYEKINFKTCNIMVALDTLDREKVVTYPENIMKIFISDICPENLIKLNKVNVNISIANNNFSYIRLLCETNMSVSIRQISKRSLIFATNTINIEILYEEALKEENSRTINVDRFLKLNTNCIIYLKRSHLKINKTLLNLSLKQDLSTVSVKLTDYELSIPFTRICFNNILNFTKTLYASKRSSEYLTYNLECKVNLEGYTIPNSIKGTCKSLINKQILTKLNSDFLYIEHTIQNISILLTTYKLTSQKCLKRLYKVFIPAAFSHPIKDTIENLKTELTFEFISKTLGDISCNFSCMVIILYPENKEQVLINKFIRKLLKRFKNILEAYSISLPELAKFNYLSKNFRHIIFSDIETSAYSRSLRNSIVVRVPSLKVFWEYLRLIALRSVLEVPNCIILLVPCEDPSKMLYELISEVEAERLALIKFLKESIGYFIPVVLIYLDESNTLRYPYSKSIGRLEQV